MGNQLNSSANNTSNSLKHQHSIFDDYKKDVPILTQTFNEHATYSPIDEKLYLTENDFSSKLFSKIPDFGVQLFKKFAPDGQPIDLYNFLKLSNEINSLCSISDQMKYYLSLFSSPSSLSSSNCDSTLMMVNEAGLEKLIKCAILSSLTIAKISSSPASSSSVPPTSSSSSPSLLSFECDNQFNVFISTLLSSSSEPATPPATTEHVLNALARHQAFCLKDLHDHVLYRLLKRTSVKKTADKTQDSLNVNNNDSQLWQSVIKGDSLLKLSGLWFLSSFVPHSFIPTSEIGTVSNFSRALEMNAWHVLYNSNLQGLSANGFSNKVLGYQGPTIMMIKFSSYLLAVGLDADWRESHQRRGGYDCFVLQFTPVYKIITNNTENLLYFNLTNRTIKKGVQLGGSNKGCTLEIDEDFSNVSYLSQKFTLSAIEVWGCGGNSCYLKYCGQKAWEANDTAKHRNRKLKIEDWKDNPDKTLLNYGGIETDHSKRGDI